LQIATGKIIQADAARNWIVGVSTTIGIRRTVKSAALAAFSAKPGSPAKGATRPSSQRARKSAS
jgi:hypothetical protein